MYFYDIFFQIIHKFIVRLILVCACVFPVRAQAVIIQINNEVIVEGEIALADVEKFSAAFLNRDIKNVIFRNSGGGKFDAGLQIGRHLATKNLPAEVQGICASACAIAFLGGDIRTFSKNVPDSALMLHPGFFSGTDVVDKNLNSILYNWIESRTNQTVPTAVKEAFDQIQGRKGGLYILSPDHGIVVRTGSRIYSCLGNEKNIQACSAMRNISVDELNFFAN